jgi:hypothetical protein
MRRQASSESIGCLLRLCGGVALLLPMLSMGLRAQLTSAPAQVALQSLHIDILEGEGALNNIRQRDAREPVVQVTDENHKPVGGAVVLFLVHEGPNGASASFGQSLSLSVTTGPDGIAHGTGLLVGKTPGSFTISVTAAVGSLVAAAVVIHQSNVLGALNSSSNPASLGGGVTSRHTILGMSKTLAVTVGSVVVAGVVVGVVQATKSSGTSVSLGAPSIGP